MLFAKRHSAFILLPTLFLVYFQQYDFYNFYSCPQKRGGASINLTAKKDISTIFIACFLH